VIALCRISPAPADANGVAFGSRTISDNDPACVGAPALTANGAAVTSGDTFHWHNDGHRLWQWMFQAEPAPTTFDIIVTDDTALVIAPVADITVPADTGVASVSFATNDQR
jgi:hypothetical protein